MRLSSDTIASGLGPAFSVEDDFAGFYRERGYVILDDLVDARQVEGLREQVLALFEARFEAAGLKAVHGEEALVANYEAGKDAWRQAARRMPDLLDVHALGSDPRVRRVLERLGLAEPIISTRPEVRTDMPGDEQYRQPLHQDWRYAQGSVNAVTFWIPLHDVSVENGTVELIPGTHVLGYLETEELSNPRRFSIVDARVEGRESLPAELRAGQAVAFSQLLAHRSGTNSSGRPRISVQLRFSDYREPRFASLGYPTPTGSDLLWPTPPSEKDARSIFSA